MKRALLTTLGIAAFFALLYAGVGSVAKFECEACVRYHGRVECGTAVAETREEAAAGAMSIACAQLAGGVTDSMRCTATPPESMECRQR
jgi:hypothetical protein